MALTIKRGVVEQLLRDRGLSQGDLATGIGADRGHISRVLSGQAPLTWSMCMRIATWLSTVPTTGEEVVVLPDSVAEVGELAGQGDGEELVESAEAM